MKSVVMYECEKCNKRYDSVFSAEHCWCEKLYQRQTSLDRLYDCLHVLDNEGLKELVNTAVTLVEIQKS